MKKEKNKCSSIQNTYNILHKNSEEKKNKTVPFVNVWRGAISAAPRANASGPRSSVRVPALPVARWADGGEEADLA